LKKNNLFVISLVSLWIALASASASAQTSKPNVIVSFQNGYLRHDVFARSSSGHVIHYWWSAQPPSGWHGEDLTAFTGGPTIVGDPVAIATYQNGYLRHDVFARGSAGHVIHYWWSAEPPSGWHGEDLTGFTSGPTIIGNPVAIDAYQNGYLRHDVFARDSAGHVIHYWWSAEPPSGWHGEDLTAFTGGPTILVDPVAVDAYQNGYLRHDVFARGSAGHVIHYWWSAQPPSGWHGEDLTAFTGGPVIATALDVDVIKNTDKQKSLLATRFTSAARPSHLLLVDRRSRSARRKPHVHSFRSNHARRSGDHEISGRNTTPASSPQALSVPASFR
jgi:hypothetical protein